MFLDPSFFGTRNFWTKTFWHPNAFGNKYIVGPKIFSDQKYFQTKNFWETKIFSDPKFFWTQTFLDQKFFSNIIGAQKFVDPNFININILDPKLFEPNIFLDPKSFLNPKTFSCSNPVSILVSVKLARQKIFKEKHWGRILIKVDQVDPTTQPYPGMFFFQLQ